MFLCASIWKSNWSQSSFFPIFSCFSKREPQQDLARSGYKTNRELENLAILLHVDEPLEPISWIWWFQKNKARNLHKSSKNLGNCKKKSSKCDDFFLELNFVFFPWPCCLGLFIIAKWWITDDPKKIRDNQKEKEEQKMGACNTGSQKVMPVKSRGVEILEVGKRK
jgi:hypothetical protein